mmetsp:Transcript_16513/g.43657  ORF Transcript_16513/g.43657 Transcript_16513/m.43657 type:complete len:209 (-) Transcript_16513:1769-2395(-)
MHTGMSAPPTEPTRCTPMTLESAAVAASSVRPPVDRNEPIRPICVVSMARLSMFLPGRLSGVEARLPLSLPNATRLPVSVTPPMKSPRTVAVRCMVDALGWIIWEAIEVIIAAPPTREWKPATHCGRARGLTWLPMARPPTPPPIISAVAIGSAEDGMPAIVAAMPPATPDMPMYAPACAVFMFASEPMAPMQNMEDTTPVAGMKAAL